MKEDQYCFISFSQIQPLTMTANLDRNDFMIVIQTPLQKQMFKAFGHNRVVCMDATHGTNIYRFHLITLLVVDDFGEGLPVAWCISNREDEHAIRQFLEEVRRNDNMDIQPQWFMSDDASQYYNAWVTSFDHRPHKLLCNWHVERAWRMQLRKLSDSDLEQEVYKQLKTLMEEPEQEMFEKLLLCVCVLISRNTRKQRNLRTILREYMRVE